MPDGDVRYGDDNLRDLTYDGERRTVRGGRQLLKGGLGQLVDGETGHTNFRVDALGKNKGERKRRILIGKQFDKFIY